MMMGDKDSGCKEVSSLVDDIGMMVKKSTIKWRWYLSAKMMIGCGDGNE